MELYYCSCSNITLGRTVDALHPDDNAAIIAYREASLTETETCFDAAVRIAEALLSLHLID